MAKALISESEKLAKSSGIKLIKSDLTSHFSQCLFKSHGWQVAYEMQYVDYKDANGTILIKTQPPHENFMLGYKILE